MKSVIVALALAVASSALLPSVADAKRLGGGGTSGMQRSLPPRSAPESLPAKPAQNNNNATSPAAAATPPAAAPRRSWLGPIAGLAAGLGLAALMSHLGMGAEFANLIMLALLAFVAFVAIRFVMARMRRSPVNAQGLQFAGASAQGTGAPLAANGPGWGAGAPLAATPAFTPPAAASNLPVGFDAAAFERIAKMIFIRMQAANDAADLTDLRNFTTPEMFAALRVDLQERGGASQQTDVVKIDAEVLDFAREAERQVVSVRFHGLIREEKDGVAAPFDEVWHLVKPADGSREWAIAGIAQNAAVA